jgi:hypothetical protein
VRDFWENYPKAIRVAGKGVLEIGLFPGEWRVPHEFRGGWRKSHEILLDARPGDRPDRVEQLASWLRDPLSVYADPAAYRDSFAPGALSVEDRARFPQYERAADAVIRYQGGDRRQGDLFREREDRDLYGWVDFGDSYRGGSKEVRYFGNNELDFSLVLLRQYVRTDSHDVDYFRTGRSIALHLAEIDTYHTDRDLFWANRGIRKHDASGIMDHSNHPYASHFWIGGLSLYHWITGDERVVPAIEGVGRWLAALESDPEKHPGTMAYSGEVRSRGWILHALVDLYEWSGEESHLERAARVVRTMIRDAMNPEGFLAGSHSQVDTWQMGYVTSALGRYLWVRARRGEKDEVAEDSLLRMLEYLRTHAWLEDAGHVAYRFDPVAKKVTAARPNVSRIQSDGFSYGFLVTGRKEYLAFAAKAFEAQDGEGYPYYYSTTLGTPAKSACFRLRFGQAYMALRQLAAPKQAVRGEILGLRRTGGGHARVDYFVDRPARCRFELRTRDGDVLRSWKEDLLFPGARRSVVPPGKEIPDGVALVLKMTPEDPWGEAGRTVEVSIDRSPRQPEEGGDGR